MVNNTVFDIFDPGMVIVAKTSAFVVTQYERDERGRRVAADWRTISISHILDSPTSTTGKSAGGSAREPVHY